ncbi:MAG: translation elongation factor 4 [Elusimicrobia bacterium]|nr:translation elongation factor 4 [Candidatus Obscuribacterium magneticum]
MSLPIRNFCIIAHIDHGKSTLADRLLEMTGTVSAREMRGQILDGMELERERGITIKAKAVRMSYEGLTLNLIDTPGHVDFTYEVSRALNACEGALLVVDASQGVEAQTLANTQLALEAGLKVIPVINKIDLPQADSDRVHEEILEILGLEEDPLLVSAKTGQGVEAVLKAIVEKIPPPQGSAEGAVAALLFDSFYDTFRGVIIFVRMVNGRLKAGEKVRFLSTGDTFVVEELGYKKMKLEPAAELTAGEVGYLILGIRDPSQVHTGDTVTAVDRPTTKHLKGYRELKPYVFCGMFPINSSDYELLKAALEKLHLQDSSFQYEPETSVALGFGYRCGFLGLLHMDIVKQRLEREFDLDLIITAPNVIYHVRDIKGVVTEIDNPSRFPENKQGQTIEEPYVKAILLAPAEYMGALIQLCQNRRGVQLDMKYLTPTRIMLHYELPLAEIVVNFYDQLKSLSKGYASFDYEPVGFRPGELVKLEILVAGEPLDALSYVVHKDQAYGWGRKITEKMRDLIPRQMFEVPLQAQVEGRVIARETIRAIRKDVLAKCYGGDVSRKRKLLEKQKEGKKRMKQFGSVEIPQSAFLAVLKLTEE